MCMKTTELHINIINKRKSSFDQNFYIGPTMKYNYLIYN